MPMSKIIKRNLNIVSEKYKSKQKTQIKSAKKNTLYNIEMLYKAGNEAIKFSDDYSS